MGKVRVLNVYEILGCHSEVELKELIDILADGNLDNIYYDNISMEKEDKYFQVELIPGQFNQREDSANEAIKIIFGREDIKVKHWKLLIFSGIEDKDLELIRRYYINPVEMRLYNEQLDARGGQLPVHVILDTAKDL